MTNSKMAAAAVSSMPDGGGEDELAALVRFREGMAAAFRRWPDTLIETVDALVCSGRPVGSPAWLSLEPELRRGYGSVYQALETPDAVDTDRLRSALVGAAAGRDVPAWFAVDVTPWPRPEAGQVPGRGMCYTAGSGPVCTPGWSLLVCAQVGAQRGSSVLPVDVQLLDPAEGERTNTNQAAAQQIRRVAAALAEQQPGTTVPLFLLDAGFCPIVLTQQVTDVAQVLVRLRGDRVFYARPEPKPAHRRGRQPIHGARFKLSEPHTWPEPDQTVQMTLHAGTEDEVVVTAEFWHRLHPVPRQRRRWVGTDPVEGTVIRRTATWTRTGHTQTWWLWWAGPPGSFDADTVAMAYLFRFNIEHGFRFGKQQLGWTGYGPLTPAAATNWSWLIMAAFAHLILGQHLAEDYRLPWDAAGPPTPARVHRVFRRIHARLPRLASAPRNSRPGPGRPPGARNRHQRPPQAVTIKGRAPNTGHPKGHRLPLAPNPRP